VTTTHLPRLEPLRTVRAGVLEVAYYQAGPAGGPPVLLLHGFPDDIHSTRASALSAEAIRRLPSPTGDTASTPAAKWSDTPFARPRYARHTCADRCRRSHWR
jgi:pimeloyl-ACP methyl ester carboxylesterase